MVPADCLPGAAVSSGNGYDARGEDTAIRRELGDLVQHQARTDERLSRTVGDIHTTIDRLAGGLGRLSSIEEALTLILKRQARMEATLDALAKAHGVEVAA